QRDRERVIAKCHGVVDQLMCRVRDRVDRVFRGVRVQLNLQHLSRLYFRFCTRHAPLKIAARRRNASQNESPCIHPPALLVFCSLSPVSPTSCYSRRPNTHSDRPEMAVTYCLPSTSYVIGPLTICAPRLAFHNRVPFRASSAWK